MDFSEHIAPEGDFRLDTLSTLAKGQPFIFLVATPSDTPTETGEPGMSLSVEVGNGIASNRTIVALLFKAAFALQDKLPPETPPDELVDTE